MITTLYLDAKLEKQLSALRRSSKKGALAADEVQDIINRIKAGQHALMETGCQTKHGELRIKGCIKFDLGSGYRLVTVKQGRKLYVLYVGSHDDCHRWIQNNRDLSVAEIQRRSRRIIVSQSNLPEDGGGIYEPMTDEPDAAGDDLESLDDRQLRILFNGLIRSVQN